MPIRRITMSDTTNGISQFVGPREVFVVTKHKKPVALLIGNAQVQELLGYIAELESQVPRSTNKNEILVFTKNLREAL